MQDQRTSEEMPASFGTITLRFSGSTPATCSTWLEVQLGQDHQWDCHGSASLDLSALLAEIASPATYEQLLDAMVFQDSVLAQAWRTAWIQADSLKLRVAVYIAVEPSLTVLDQIRWEQLLHPITRHSLALDELVTIVRRVSRLEQRPLSLPVRSDLKALLVVSNPIDIERYKLSRLDHVADSVQAFERLLAPLPVQVIAREAPGGSEPATLKRVMNALSGTTIIITICHGQVIDGMPYLYLEDEHGLVARVSGKAIASAVQGLQLRPRLWVIAACGSAGESDPGDSHTSLGALLVQSGVAATIGMLDRVAVSSALTFAKTLMQALREHSYFDLAVAEARRSLRESQDWWQPVLFRDPSAPLLWARVTKTPPQPSGPPPVVSQPGLVRRESLGRLQERWREHAALTLTGAAGTGKSILAAQLLSTETENGPSPIPVLWYDCREPTAGGLVHALAGWLAHEGYQEYWERLNSPHTHMLEERSSIVTAMARLLAGSTRILCVDHADHVALGDELWVVLAKLATLVNLKRFCLLVVARQVIEHLDLPAEVIGGLSITEIAQLPVCRDFGLTDAQISLLQQQTAGNVMLLRLVASWLRRSRRRVDHDLVKLIDESEIARFLREQLLGTQATQARMVLEAVAVLRPEFATTETISSLIGQSKQEIDLSLEQLQWDGLIEAIERDHVVMAELLLARVYEDLDSDRRRWLHLRAAEHYELRKREYLLRWLYHLAKAGAPELFQALRAHGHDLLRHGHISMLQHLLQTSESTTTDEDEQVELAIWGAEVAVTLGNSEEGLRWCAQADRALSETDPRRAEILQLMGLCADWSGGYTRARELYGKAYKLALATEQWGLAARCLHNQGCCYELEGQDALALSSYQESIELKRRHDLVHDIPVTMVNMGGLLYHLAPEHWDEAVQTLSSARWRATDGKNVRVEGNALSNLGTAFREQGDLEEALQYFREAEATFGKAGYRYDLADTYFRMAEILLEQGCANDAVDFAKRALTIFETVRNEEGILWATRALAEAELSLGDHIAAGKLLYSWQSATALAGVTDIYERILLLIALGNLAQVRGDREEALWRWREALQLAVKHEFNHLVDRIRGLLDT